ncbi:carbohydrate-binding family 9-like protein [Persicitalea sp.]|uniref:carbohydrate-binding family 9-like protein n=1 Tax=Persicitalea sp. TaxID=3100273 RepID=UPI0035936EC2
MTADTYEITLPDHHWLSLPQKYFREAGDGAEATQETLVRLRQDGDILTVEFECHGNPFWRQNTYKEDNTSLWKQEVFEIFIAAGEATPSRYIELEINPNDALFVGSVHNPGPQGDGIKLTMVPPKESGISHKITQTTASTWRGELHIPLKFVNGSAGDAVDSVYRVNFYRIVLLEPQADPNWECTPENSSFQCWSPTLSGAKPHFHRPERFGVLRLL